VRGIIRYREEQLVGWGVNRRSLRAKIIGLVEERQRGVCNRKKGSGVVGRDQMCRQAWRCSTDGCNRWKGRKQKDWIYE
jgi:hypothetical protein